MNIGTPIFAILFVATLMIASADALTKDQAAQQLVEREQAKLKSNETRAILPNPSLKVIAVQLSKMCLYKAEKNLPSICPNYEDLVKYDTTNQKFIGGFVDMPYFHRAKSPVLLPSNSLKQLTDYIVCVDCPNDVLFKSKIITITNNKLVYTKDSDKKIVNNTRYEYIGRAIDEGCGSATIYYDDLLLNDTINYLKSDCKETSFNEKITIKPAWTKHDIKTTKMWKYKMMIEEAKKLKGINCLKSDLC